ncbi:MULTISPECIES: AraC family transcriptional regulator [unclassified Mycobacterium]|uniref:AraC family transcriptional regulator n=1 Tax=unclassified Mycobacterium TaxID=2642494 RepID=UPI0029C83470|nr:MULTISPECIES: AraC family transcriptional regulator [unclassified Mycobacterium]
MGYRELPPPTALRELVEAAWVVDGPGDVVRVLPDGCMDLIRMHGRVVVAGPDTAASVSARGPEPFAGLRFRPGALPRLLGVPAAELRDQRIALDELGITCPERPLTELASELAARAPRNELAPWSLTTLRHVTARLAAGAPVAEVASDAGWSNRTLQRQSHAVYGYGPATLRRVLRFRRAVSMLRAGRAPADVAAAAGYSDQPHLHREVRALAGTTVAGLAGD